MRLVGLDLEAPVGSAAVGDGIVRFGMPLGGEVLVPGAPFQRENGYLGMWNWEKQGARPVPKDQTPEAQKVLMANFQAERAKFDAEAKAEQPESTPTEPVAEAAPAAPAPAEEPAAESAPAEPSVDEVEAAPATPAAATPEASAAPVES